MNNSIPEGFEKTFKQWNSKQKELFLGKLLQNTDKINQTTISYIKNNLTVMNNNMEVQFLWLSIELALKDKSIISLLDEFLVNIGRMKFIRPLYNSLYDMDKNYALQSFEKNKALYHPILVNLITKDFSNKEKKSIKKLVK